MDSVRWKLPSITIDTPVLYDLCYYLREAYVEAEKKYQSPTTNQEMSKESETELFLQYKLVNKTGEVTVNTPGIFINSFYPKELKKIEMYFHKDVNNEIKIRIDLEYTSRSWFIVSSIDSNWFEKIRKDLNEIFDKYKTSNESLNLGWTLGGLAHVFLAILTGFLISLPFTSMAGQEYIFIKYIIAVTTSLASLYGWHKLLQWLYPQYETTAMWRIKYRTISILVITAIIMTVAFSYRATSISNDILFTVILKVFALLAGFVIYYFLTLFWRELARELWIMIVWRWMMLYLCLRSHLRMKKISDVESRFKTDKGQNNLQTVVLEDSIEDVLKKFCDELVAVVDKEKKPLGILYKEDLLWDGSNQAPEIRLKDVLMRMGTESLTGKNWNMKGVNNFALVYPNNNLQHTLEKMHHIGIPFNRGNICCIVVNEESGIIERILRYDPLLDWVHWAYNKEIERSSRSRIIASACRWGFDRAIMTIGIFAILTVILVKLHLIILAYPLSPLTDTIRSLDIVIAAVITAIIAFDFGSKMGKNKMIIRIPLQMTSKSPSPFSKGISVDSHVQVTFSNPIREYTLKEKNFNVMDQDKKIITGNFIFSSDGKTASLVPDNKLNNDTEYTAIVTTRVRDLVGNRLVVPEEWSFTTESESNNTVPPVPPAAKPPPPVVPQPTVLQSTSS